MSVIIVIYSVKMKIYSFSICYLVICHLSSWHFVIFHSVNCMLIAKFFKGRQPDCRRNLIQLSENLNFWVLVVFFYLLRFLDASSHLYKRVCPSVGWFVRPSVRPSVMRFFQIEEMKVFLRVCHQGGLVTSQKCRIASLHL